MKSFIKLSLLIAPVLGVLSCNSTSSSSSNSNVNSASSSVDLSSSSNSGSYSYDFPKKEAGLTLDEITEEVGKLPAEERKRVRYTWHFEEKLTGTYPMTMKDGSDMPAGEYVLDFVTEPKQHNLDSNIKIISGTPVTKNQQYFTSYTSSITASGWLSYHKDRRRFLDSAQEGEGFEERFYTGPLTLWMTIWGVRVQNANMDGTYFGVEEFERTYNEEGYCQTFKIHEFHYMKGTLSSFMGGTHDYDGTYEYNGVCTIEYLEE